MRTDALANTDERSEELRYVTTHFKDLQGLRLAPIWTAFLTLSSAGPSLHRLPPWQRLTAALAIFLPGLALSVWSHRWYTRRYGFVKRPEPVISSGFNSILHPEPQSRGTRDRSGVLFRCFLVVMLIVPHLFQRFDGHSGSETFPLLLMIFVLPRCLYATNSTALIRVRRILSIAASVVICAMYVTFLLIRSGKWSDLAGVYALLLLLDLYDHWLFTRLLNGGSAGHSYE